MLYYNMITEFEIIIFTYVFGIIISSIILYYASLIIIETRKNKLNNYEDINQ